MNSLTHNWLNHTPESLLTNLQGEPGLVLLRSHCFESPQARYSFLTARPFLTFKSWGARCEIASADSGHVQFGNPWRVLESWMGRYELLDEIDFPFPLGGCFGYWGYDLKNFVEPSLSRNATDDLELPHCQVGFYASLVAFDHRLDKTWIISTGLGADGSRTRARAEEDLEFWVKQLETPPFIGAANPRPSAPPLPLSAIVESDTAARFQFTDAVERALRYIRSGDIYQVNLSRRWQFPSPLSGWEFYQQLNACSPAPFSAFLDCGPFQIASSSPELFLRLSGSHIQTRPIKGTRPRSPDPTRDAQLAYELQTSPKDLAELVMITDLLRNDLGKICEFGSVQVPDLVRLERYSQVQHLVSTIEGRLRPELTHSAAFASCFPGGSITGAPKIRAMQIIDELEPVTRGPYTGSLGYLGFNRESQLNILIRTAICRSPDVFFHAGAGIVADSNPESEYDETLAKARGFFDTIARSRVSQTTQ